MEEVTKEKFYEVIREIPYKIQTTLEKEAHYIGKSKKFKDSMFAKEKDGKYFVLTLLSLKPLI